jgi:hypothetical protein
MQGFAPISSLPISTLPAAGGTTVALTGVSSTSAVGTLGVQESVGLTNALATSALGSFTPTGTIALSSASATSATGTLVAAILKALTNVLGTSAVGTIVPGLATALTSDTGTSAVGSLGVQGSIALVSSSSTSSVGTLTPGNTEAITGVSSTSSVGTFTVSETVALTGDEGDTSIGILTPSSSGSVTIALTGVQAQGLVGNLGLPITVTQPQLDGASTHFRDVRRLRSAKITDGIRVTVESKLTRGKPVKLRLRTQKTTLHDCGVFGKVEIKCGASLSVAPFNRTLRIVKCDSSILVESRSSMTSVDRDLQDFYLLLQAA